MNSSNPTGVENSVCAAGETQSFPTGMPRTLAISSLTFDPGKTPPCPGFAPCESLSSTPEVSRPDLPDDVASVPLVIFAQSALTRVMRKPAFRSASVEREDRIAAE